MEGKLLEFDTPQNLINFLPSKGLVARISIENLSQDIIKTIQKYHSIEKVIRVGNETIEVFMERFEDNLPKLMKFLFENNIEVKSMSRDIANFRRYFQIRIQEEEEKENEKNRYDSINEGGRK